MDKLELEQLLRLADQLNVKQINIEVEPDVAVAEEIEMLIDTIKQHLNLKENR